MRGRPHIAGGFSCGMKKLTEEEWRGDRNFLSILLAVLSLFFSATKERLPAMQICVDLTTCLSTEKSWTPSAFEPRQQFPSSRANCSDRTLNSVDTTPV